MIRQLGKWLVGGWFAWVAPCAYSATPTPTQTSTPQTWEFSAVLCPRLVFSDHKEIPLGGGIALQGVAFPVQQFGFGLSGAWSRHGAHDFWRAELFLQVLIDDLVIQPFLQAGVGLQLRSQRGLVGITPDLALSLGFDLPLLRWFAIGASFQLYFPIDADTFPLTKTLHLRLRLLF